MEKANNVNVENRSEMTDVQRISYQLAKFFARVQSAEDRKDTSYRALIKHFRLLDISGRQPDHIFDAMQILYADVLPDQEKVSYSDDETQAFLATLKLYALAYCTQNRKPNAPRSGGDRPDSLATACGKFAWATKSQKWCTDRMAAFLESKRLVSNFRYLENIVSRIGKASYRFDYIRLFQDLVMMFSKNRKLGTDVRRRWAEQYARAANKISSSDNENSKEGE